MKKRVLGLLILADFLPLFIVFLWFSFLFSPELYEPSPRIVSIFVISLPLHFVVMGSLVALVTHLRAHWKFLLAAGMVFLFWLGVALTYYFIFLYTLYYLEHTTTMTPEVIGPTREVLKVKASALFRNYPLSWFFFQFVFTWPAWLGVVIGQGVNGIAAVRKKKLNTRT